MSAVTRPGGEAAPSTPTRDPTPAGGLGSDEVAARVAAGDTNATRERTSRTLGEIVRANVFTRFNAILGSMLVIILAVGPIQDALFGLVVISNALIGIVQEIRAKRTLDRLAVLSAPRARVVRDGEVRDVAVDDVVLDDLVELRSGDQVPCDGEVRDVEGLEVDESLLTGESDPVDKHEGDDVLSGSFVVAGRGCFQATRVGDDAYARRLAREARRFGLVRSELMDGINLILRFVTWAIIPTSTLLALSQFTVHDDWKESMVGIVAGVVAMVPDGLVLLTSISFGLAAVTLARRRVLVQELPAVEGLARVDVVCLDKTGTLTEGTIAFASVDLLTSDPVDEALGALAAGEDRNATSAALAEAFPSPGWSRTAAVAFSSARKWSAASFDGHGTWVLGAPEMVLPDAPADDPVRAAADRHSSGGHRTLLLARSDAALDGEALPPSLESVALVLFEEKVRADAADTLAYFRTQGVALKVISGDNPRTVGAVAGRVGLEGADDPVDARELPEDPDALAEVLDRHSVFGRVSPHQKRAMVGALQSRGHVVAMTGDGVNDALALKDADIGVAMGSGAAATRAVAQIVLLDGRFAHMPGVVAEGRRVIANIERVANLFVTKTVYATLFAVAVGALRWPYPFLPRHLTVVSSLTIGIPAFFLALAPNLRRYVPGFVGRVIRFTVPTGIVAGTATLAAYAYAREVVGLDDNPARTTATLTLLVIGLWVLGVLARPFTWWRAALVAAMVVLFVLSLVVPVVAEFYALEMPPAEATVAAAVAAFVACALIEGGWEVDQRRQPPGRRVRRLRPRGGPLDGSDDGGPDPTATTRGPRDAAPTIVGDDRRRGP